MQACRRNQFLKHLRSTGLSVAYLRARARDINPKLMLKVERLKPEFSDADKERRVKFCKEMLDKPPEFVKSIVWIDESSVPLTPVPQTYIGERGEERYTRTDPRMGKTVWDKPRLYYLLAVCYATGLVKLDILSFTPGYEDPVQYLVSAAAQPPAASCQLTSTGPTRLVRP